jgi:hypothetical protein
LITRAQGDSELLNLFCVFHGTPLGAGLVVLGIEIVAPGEHLSNLPQSRLVLERRDRLERNHLGVALVIDG